MINAAKVYWIHLPEHTDMFTQGYVGFTTKPDVKKRINEHVGLANMRAMRSIHLENAIRKHGIKNLRVRTLCIGAPDYCLEVERKLRPHHGIGWNLAIGGDKPAIGRVVTAKTREKLRKNSTGRIFNAEWKARIRAAKIGNKVNLGKKLSESTKEKIRQANIGKKYSEETRAKQSAMRLGKSIPKPAGFGEKISAILRIRMRDPLVREKMSKSAKARCERIEVCPHCGESGKMMLMRRRHMNNCKYRKE